MNLNYIYIKNSRNIETKKWKSKKATTNFNPKWLNYHSIAQIGSSDFNARISVFFIFWPRQTTHPEFTFKLTKTFIKIMHIRNILPKLYAKY